MKSVKIYEMLMRDGFQSLDKTYNLETKKEVIKLLIECNNNNIEFGSTTSKKLLPQLGDTFELWEYIKELNMNKNIDNYTILNTSKKGLERSIECGIKSHSLICSISDKFSLLNLHIDSSIKTLYNVLEQINIIRNTDYELIRVYLSCSFGSKWELSDDKYIDKLVHYIKILYEYGLKNNISYKNFDIVLSDTIGILQAERLNTILDIINKELHEEVFDYIGLHLHCDNNFEDLVDISLKYNIYKYDSSMLGIGGCPFSENKLVGNISTINLVKYLNNNNITTNIKMDKIDICNKKIKELII